MKYYSKFIFTAIFLTIIFILLPTGLKAQMFSIGDDERERREGINLFTMIGASWELAEFTYQGEGATDRERLDFNDSILRLRLDSPGLDLSFAFGGGLTGMDNTSYFNVNGRLYNSFPISRSPKFLLMLPLQITSDLQQVKQNQSEADFTQSSLALGTGVSTIFKIGNGISVNLKATPNYGFSFSQGSLFGGSLFRFDGKGLIYIHNVFGSNALTLGYHFDHRVYRIEGNLNDYDYTSHSITVGYAF